MSDSPLVSPACIMLLLCLLLCLSRLPQGARQRGEGQGQGEEEEEESSQVQAHEGVEAPEPQGGPQQDTQPPQGQELNPTEPGDDRAPLELEENGPLRALGRTTPSPIN